jgi:hypothetical protein
LRPLWQRGEAPPREIRLKQLSQDEDREVAAMTNEMRKERDRRRLWLLGSAILGVMISTAQSQTPLAFAAIILLTLISILLFYAIEMLEKRFGRVDAVVDYERWQKRDLSAPRYVCVWADGIFLQARMEDHGECMLVRWS